MILSPPEHIAEYTSQGWWGSETLWTRVLATIQRAPQGDALVDPPNRAELCGGAPVRLGYAELGRRVDNACARLVGAGLAPGDRVLVQLPNVHEAVILLLACARTGIIASPVPMQYRRHELEAIVGLLEPRLAITVPIFKGFDHAAMLAALMHDAAAVLLVGGARPSPFGSFDPAVDAAARRDPWPQPSANDVLTICWTSGTEGVPRGVPRSHNQWLAIARLREGVQGEVILSGFPLVNMAAISGALGFWCLTGGKLVLHHPFDLGIFLRQIEHERVTGTSLPPPLLDRIAADPACTAGIDLSSLRLVSSGAAPLVPEVLRTLHERLGIAVANAFGSNEGACFFATPSNVADPEVRASLFPAEYLGADGRLRMRLDSRLVDPDNGTVVEEPGVAAELQIRGPTVFDGYWRAGDVQAFTADGWFRTGDLMQIEYPAGGRRFYRFVARRKELIVRGGFKVAPIEIDRLLAGCPEVERAATVGVPDPAIGERICVAVVPRPGAVPSVASLGDYLRAQGLAPNKLPERVLLVDELPCNPLGKVVRGAVRGLFEAQPARPDDSQGAAADRRRANEA